MSVITNGAQPADDAGEVEPRDVNEAVYLWSVDFLSQCQASTIELRDKACFLSFDELADVLELARGQCEQLLGALIAARAGPEGSLQDWIDSHRSRS